MKIVDSLKKMSVKIDSVFLDPKNARKHNDRNIVAIAKSLELYGQRKPIVVNANNNIIEAGNGTFLAAKLLGAEKIAAIFVDDSEEVAAKYAIMDNRTAELAEWDIDNLQDVIDRCNLGTSPEEIGFTKAEIDKIFSENELHDIMLEFDSVDTKMKVFSVALPDEIYNRINTYIAYITNNSDYLKDLNFNRSAANQRKTQFFSELNCPKRDLTENEAFFLFCELSFFHFLRQKNKADKLYKIGLVGTQSEIIELYNFLMETGESQIKIDKNFKMSAILNRLKNDKKLS